MHTEDPERGFLVFLWYDFCMDETNTNKGDIAEETGDKQEKKDTRFKPGQSGNPNGRPAGALSFSTKWRKAIEKIAEKTGTNPDDLEEQLLLVGFRKAKDGDYRFWGDIHDRVYGKPIQKQEIGGPDGAPINIIISKDDGTNP